MKIAKYLVLSIMLLSSVFVLTFVVSAQTNKEAEKKYGIGYPIAELANCTDFISCRTYCDDLTHRDACIDFAKKKGFYKEDPLVRKKTEMLAASKTELGCDTAENCKKICEDESNFEKCSEFAKKYGVGSGQVLSDKNENILSKAKQILGCDSPSNCKAVCEKEENREKCSEFAKQTGLRGGKKMEGPGGCNSKESCESFCSDPNNFEACKKFGPGPEGKAKPGNPQNGFKGPGGCDSKETCEKYCREHEDECRKNGGDPIDKNPGNLEKLCQENPDKCKEIMQNGREGRRQENREDFCKQNPEKCKNIIEKSAGMKPGDSEFCKNNPEKCKERFDRPGEFGGVEENKPSEDFCKQNPEKCRLPPGDINQEKSREDYCREHPQECEKRQPEITNKNQPPEIDRAQECGNRGCGWNGATCICPDSSQNIQQNNVNSEVKGISTRNLPIIEYILDFLR